MRRTGMLTVVLAALSATALPLRAQQGAYQIAQVRQPDGSLQTVQVFNPSPGQGHFEPILTRQPNGQQRVGWMWSPNPNSTAASNVRFEQVLVKNADGSITQQPVLNANNPLPANAPQQVAQAVQAVPSHLPPAPQQQTQMNEGRWETVTYADKGKPTTVLVWNPAPTSGHFEAVQVQSANGPGTIGWVWQENPNRPANAPVVTKIDRIAVQNADGSRAIYDVTDASRGHFNTLFTIRADGSTDIQRSLLLPAPGQENQPGRYNLTTNAHPSGVVTVERQWVPLQGTASAAPVGEYRMETQRGVDGSLVIRQAWTPGEAGARQATERP